MRVSVELVQCEGGGLGLANTITAGAMMIRLPATPGLPAFPAWNSAHLSPSLHTQKSTHIGLN